MQPEIPSRAPFEGMLNIVRFNWPLYAAASGCAAVAILVSLVFQAPLPVRILVFCGGLAAVFYLCVSLLVSHWIYDRSPLYRWEWITRVIPIGSNNITNIHAGFDESSESLKALYPDARLEILDFYDPVQNSEPSIARARRHRPAGLPAKAISATRIPLPDASQDAVILCLAAHEIRSRSAREDFFREIARILRKNGRVVLVEHLRDAANFLAFGPGAFHFHSRREWLHAMDSAMLKLNDEFAITPFVRVFSCSSST